MSDHILAIDTSSEACSVALRFEKRVLTREEKLPRRHQERLPILIRELMEESGVSRDALDAVAFGRGPGSFTGLRLAAATAQAWGMAGNLPVYPVSSLAALALRAVWERGASAGICALNICTMVRARSSEVYVGNFAWDGQALRETSAPQRTRVSLVKLDASIDLAVGDGCLEVDCGHIPSEPELLPSAEAVLMLARPPIKACDAAHALPVYLQADADWGAMGVKPS